MLKCKEDNFVCLDFPPRVIFSDSPMRVSGWVATVYPIKNVMITLDGKELFFTRIDRSGVRRSYPQFSNEQIQGFDAVVDSFSPNAGPDYKNAVITVYVEMTNGKRLDFCLEFPVFKTVVGALGHFNVTDKEDEFYKLLESYFKLIDSNGLLQLLSWSEQLESNSDTYDQPRNLTTKYHEIKMDKLLSRFMSLGSNCELGIVQRKFCAEPLDLLRFSTSPIDQLLEGLRTEYKGVGTADCTIMSVHLGEYRISDRRYAFNTHTFIKPAGDQSEVERIFTKQCMRLSFLREKFINDLKFGNRICVYSSRNKLTNSQMLKLRDALNIYAPIPLLFVFPSAFEDKQCNSIENLDNNTAIGYIERLADVGDVAGTTPYTSWLELLVKISRLFSHDR